MRILLSIGCVAALIASACSSARWYDARFVPAPLEVEVAAQAAPGSQVRALVSVLGIAKPDEQARRGRRVEMRLRFENLGSVEARLVPDGFSLVSADLRPFGGAEIDSSADLAVPATQSRTYDVAFAAPEGDVDWSGLNLRFTLAFDGVRVATGGTFTRAAYAPVEPVHWHVGFGYSRHW